MEQSSEKVEEAEQDEDSKVNSREGEPKDFRKSLSSQKVRNGKTLEKSCPFILKGVAELRAV